jgi:hypothetical protein
VWTRVLTPSNIAALARTSVCTAATAPTLFPASQVLYLPFNTGTGASTANLALDGSQFSEGARPGSGVGCTAVLPPVEWSDCTRTALRPVDSVTCSWAGLFDEGVGMGLTRVCLSSFQHGPCDVADYVDLNVGSATVQVPLLGTMSSGRVDACRGPGAF